MICWAGTSFPVLRFLIPRALLSCAFIGSRTVYRMCCWRPPCATLSQSRGHSEWRTRWPYRQLPFLLVRQMANKETKDDACLPEGDSHCRGRETREGSGLEGASVGRVWFPLRRVHWACPGGEEAAVKYLDKRKCRVPDTKGNWHVGGQESPPESAVKGAGRGRQERTDA